MALKEELARRRSLYRLAVARSDISGAHEIATYANDHVKEPSDTLWLPLQDALVVTYARPFTSNKPFGPLASRWGKFDRRKHQELHRELLQMRHQVVAHTDASQRSVVVIPPGTQPPVAGQEPRAKATLAVTAERPMPDYFGAVADLCVDLFTRLNEAVDDELQRLFGAIEPVAPFDLMTGEEHAGLGLGGILISDRKLPGT